jgi:hypothetical protein
MASLSISRAWDETKARVATDGRLLTIVAAALIVLPALVSGVVSPATSRASSLTETVVTFIASLIAVIGQLAIIRLSIGPSTSVGEAINHGARRLWAYVLAVLLLAIALLAVLIPIGVVLAATGVPMERGSAAAREALAHSPVAMLLLLLYLVLIVFIAIRMLMTSPVASEEAAGPVDILRRSWNLTAGHWWRLFGFIILFFIGAGIAVTAINWVVAFVAVMLLGPVEPLSASALIVALVDAVVNGIVTVFLAVMLAMIYLQLAGRAGAPVSVPSSGT